MSADWWIVTSSSTWLANSASLAHVSDWSLKGVKTDDINSVGGKLTCSRTVETGTSLNFNLNNGIKNSNKKDYTSLVWWIISAESAFSRNLVFPNRREGWEPDCAGSRHVVYSPFFVWLFVIIHGKYIRRRLYIDTFSTATKIGVKVMTLFIYMALLLPNKDNSLYFQHIYFRNSLRDSSLPASLILR